MTPASPVFPGTGIREVVYGRDQPEYLDLPAVRDPGTDGRITTRWKLTWRERLQVLFRGQLWVQVLTFHKALQPLKFTTSVPDFDP